MVWQAGESRLILLRENLHANQAWYNPTMESGGEQGGAGQVGRELVPLVEHKEGLSLEAFGRSIPKDPFRPDRNEDAFDIDKVAGVAVVCDGMGGLPDGKRAANTAKGFLMDALGNLESNDPELVKQKMREGLIEASDKIHDLVKNSGTTATVVKFVRVGGATRAIIGHVGDSRAYRVSPHEREMAQITRDDSFLQKSDLPAEKKREMLQRLERVMSARDIETPEEYRWWNQRNRLTQWLGKEGGVSPQIYDIPVKKGDIVLLTSDGVHDNLSSREVGQVAVITNEVALVNWITQKARWRATGEEYDEALSQKPLYERLAVRTKWRVKGKPKHFRAKPDDITAVAVKVV